MKFNLLIVSLASAISIAHAQLNITPEIEGVTVFTRGAEILHHAETQLSTGKTTVVFTGLSPDMNASSIVLDV